MTMSTNVPQANYTRKRNMNDGSIKPVSKDRYEVKLNSTVICKITVCDFFTGVLDPAEYLEYLGMSLPSLQLENTDRNVLVKQALGNDIERKFFINGTSNQRLTVKDVQEDLIPIFAEGNFTIKKVESPDQVEQNGLEKLRKEAEALKLAKQLGEEEVDDITKDDNPF